MFLAASLVPLLPQGCLLELLHTWTLNLSAIWVPLLMDVVSFRTCIQDIGQRPIRMWWEDLMRGRSGAHFSLPQLWEAQWEEHFHLGPN